VVLIVSVLAEVPGIILIMSMELGLVLLKPERLREIVGAGLSFSGLERMKRAIEGGETII
jgi:hypothetical protein